MRPLARPIGRRRLVHGVTLLAGVLAACAVPRLTPPPVPTTVIAGSTVVDVEQGVLRPDYNVIVSAGIIRAMGPASTTPVPRGARVVDARGGYLIPGLVDMHAHPFGEGAFSRPEDAPVFGTDALQLYLDHGVTTIRVMAGSPRALDARKRVASGALAGPRMIVCGPHVITARLPRAVKTAEGARREVAEQHAAGYDCIKMYARFSPANRAVYDAVLDEAGARGLPVVGHAAYELPPHVAFRMRTVEHQEHLPRFFETPRVTPAGRDSALAALKTSGAFVTPTIAVHDVHRYIDSATLAARLNEPDMRFVNPEVLSRERRAIAARTHYLQDSAEARSQNFFMKQALRATRLLHEAGIPLLAGSEGGAVFVLMPGITMHRELELLVQAGLTPLDALRAATTNAARALGEEQSRGNVRVGASADLVLLDGNPLADIANVRRIRWVIAASCQSVPCRRGDSRDSTATPSPPASASARRNPPTHDTPSSSSTTAENRAPHRERR